MSYDQFLIALCLWREARGSSMASRVAILNVILNRALDPANRWPKSPHAVVTQAKQFSSFNANDPNVTQWPTEKNVLDWKAWEDCLAIAQAPNAADPTEGANGYESIPNGSPRPAWADLTKLTTTIGPFRFYRL